MTQMMLGQYNVKVFSLVGKLQTILPNLHLIRKNQCPVDFLPQ